MEALNFVAVWVCGLLAGGIFGRPRWRPLDEDDVAAAWLHGWGVRVRMHPAVARSSPMTAA